MTELFQISELENEVNQELNELENKLNQQVILMHWSNQIFYFQISKVENDISSVDRKVNNHLKHLIDNIIFLKVEDKSVGNHYFKYAPSTYWLNDQGSHYMNFHSKIHGGVNLSDGAFTCAKVNC